MLTKIEFEPMQIHTKGGGGGQTFNVPNSNNPADCVLIVILIGMIDIKFEKDPITIE